MKRNNRTEVLGFTWGGARFLGQGHAWRKTDVLGGSGRCIAVPGSGHQWPQAPDTPRPPRSPAPRGTDRDPSLLKGWGSSAIRKYAKAVQRLLRESFSVWTSPCPAEVSHHLGLLQKQRRDYDRLLCSYAFSLQTMKYPRDFSKEPGDIVPRVSYSLQNSKVLMYPEDAPGSCITQSEA